jgi:hypothetical protein
VHGAGLGNIQNFIALTIRASNDGMLSLIQSIHKLIMTGKYFTNKTASLTNRIETKRSIYW